MWVSCDIITSTCSASQAGIILFSQMPIGHCHKCSRLRMMDSLLFDCTVSPHWFWSCSSNQWLNCNRSSYTVSLTDATQYFVPDGVHGTPLYHSSIVWQMASLFACRSPWIDIPFLSTITARTHIPNGRCSEQWVWCLQFPCCYQ